MMNAKDAMKIRDELVSSGHYERRGETPPTDAQVEMLVTNTPDLTEEQVREYLEMSSDELARYIGGGGDDGEN